MKLKLADARKSTKEQGSALVISMLVVLVTIPLLLTYVTSVQQEYRNVLRSQEWNSSLTMVEAGIEEGFAHLNKSCYSNEVNIGVLNWDADHWALMDTSKTAIYIPRRTITNTTQRITNGFYDVRIITNYPAYGVTPKNPQIVCLGITPSPLTKAGGGFAYRQVRVSTRLRSKYALGMLANGDITGSGQFYMDAFNSGQWNESFYGYWDSRYHVAQGTIGSLNGHINLGSQGQVWGSGQTGNGADQYITNGTMGDMTWMTNGSSGIQSNSYTKDLNATIDSVDLPNTTFATLTRCDCVTTYIEPTRTAITVTTIDFPNPLPPGPIITNTSGLGSTTNYPNPVPSGGVYTNTITISNLTSLPSPIPLHYFNVQTNYNSSTWFTNTANNQTTAPVYPTVYSTPPGVLRDTLVVSNYMTDPPPSGCYVGSWNYVYVQQKVKGVWTNVIDTTSHGQVTQTNYTYEWIQDYRYANQTNTYSYSYLQYSYTNGLSYTYETTNETQKMVTGTVGYVLPTGFWEIDSLTLKNSGDKVVVTGDAVLYIHNAFSISGQGQMILTPGSSLTLYVGGDVDIKGNGVANEGGMARDLTLYGLDTCTSISLGGNAGWVGTIYAPKATVTAGGGGNDNSDIRGAIVANSIKFNGHFNLHFDLDLLNNGPSDGFVGSSWVEEQVGTLP